MWITSHAKSDVGRHRKNNEDYYLVDDMLGVYIVCDGVGGHEQGEVASKEGATSALAHIAANREVINNFQDTPTGREALRSLVRDAVQAGGRRVWQLASGEEGRARMGSTLTMLLVVGEKGIMGHIGDSRLYVRRGEETHQLSEDHTYLNELLKKGEIKLEETKDHPFANVVTRVLGQHEWVQVDTLIFDILPKDTYLLCSDGLSGYFMYNSEIGEHLIADDADSIPDELIRLSLERGGKDNITAIVLRAEMDDADTFESDRTDEITLQFTTLKYVAVFQYLTHKELMQVQHISDTLNLTPGQMVIEEGSAGDSLYVVLHGKLSVSRSGQHITYLQTGTHFGEMALLNVRPRSATVQAEVDTRLLAMSRDQFNELVRREPTLGVKLLWSFAQVLSLRLDDVSDQLYGATQPTARLIEPPFARPNS